MSPDWRLINSFVAFRKIPVLPEKLTLPFFTEVPKMPNRIYVLDQYAAFICPSRPVVIIWRWHWILSLLTCCSLMSFLFSFRAETLEKRQPDRNKHWLQTWKISRILLLKRAGFLLCYMHQRILWLRFLIWRLYLRSSQRDVMFRFQCYLLLEQNFQMVTTALPKFAQSFLNAIFSTLHSNNNVLVSHKLICKWFNFCLIE